MDVPGTLAAIAEAITETRRATTSAVRDVHVELLRQMHELGEAQRLAFSEIKHAQADLAKEVAALRRAQLEFVRR
jgi:ABC-type proline/glycine betaine transport system permease subunit